MRHKAETLLLALGGLAMALWVPSCMIRTGFDIVREGSVWEQGATATNVSAYAKEHTAVVFRAYDADVSYTVTGGSRRHANAKFYSVWKQVWTLHSRPVVKYDPEDVNSFALSWSQELGWGRWMAIPVVVVPSFALGLILLLYAVSELRHGPRTRSPAPTVIDL